MKTNLEISNKLPKHYLDTLELTLDYFQNKNHAKQYYKAIRKKKTILKIQSIIDAIPNQPQAQKRYWKTYHCNNIILQDGDKFTGSLCRKRWCTECCRIKTAELTNAYKEPIKAIGQLYFVTLTIPNIQAKQLEPTIAKMIKAFQLIKNNIRKTYNIKLNGMRKIETTYNENSNTYHPHFHLIQDNLQASELILSLWLKQFPQATHKAQDIRKIDTSNDNSFIELFKYATKETTKDGKQYTGDVLHTIYEAIKGKRIYQTYGTIKKVKAPVEALTEPMQLEYIKPQMEIWYYENNLIDWITSNNELMINTLEIKNKIDTQKLISLKT